MLTDEIKAVYKYIRSLMDGREILLYKVNHEVVEPNEYLDLYYGHGGEIRIRIKSSVSISKYMIDDAFDMNWEPWKLVASVDLGDPNCFEKLRAAFDRVLI